MPLGCQNRKFLPNWKGWLLELESSRGLCGRGRGVAERWLLGYSHLLQTGWGLSQAPGVQGSELHLTQARDEVRMWPPSGRHKRSIEQSS